jgi:glycosyltransferase involved in cell wall biosynthesis
VPLLFRGDSHFLGRGRPRFLTRTMLRALYAQFSAALYTGAANRDYFSTLGMPSEKLFFAPHAVNHELFDPQQPAHVSRAATVRAQLGIAPETRVLLFAGKFEPKKQPLRLLKAFLTSYRPGLAAIFIGDGSEKLALVEMARTAPAGAVHFLPFVNQSEMPGHLLAADIFALPSHGFYETWGLAINEAMHMGVPCLVSDLVGCQRDLVEPGCTGWVFAADAPDGLERELKNALECPAAEIRVFEANARARVANYTYPHTTAGLLAALKKIA